MSTLGTMKARIADEFAGRTDLLAQIEAAIRSAILTHGGERWWFGDALLTPTVGAGLDTLVLAGPNGEAVLAVDGLRVQWGGYWTDARHRPLDYIEERRGTGMRGPPGDFAWFGGALFLSPVPLADTPLRVQACLSPVAPAADDTAGNSWMVHAEDLIRHTAAADVLANVIQDQGMAAVRATQAEIARRRLMARRTPAPTGRLEATYL